MTPLFFPDQYEFRKWLEKNHQTHAELIVGYYKVGTGKPSLTWSQSVDQALCFGWIDGIRRSIDNESYCIRFTPRRASSIWSNINIKKVEMLQKEGLMTKPGLDAFMCRKDLKSGIYSFEKDLSVLDMQYEELFRANQAAWDFFCSQPPSYRKGVTNWIMSAKQEKTQLSRLNKAIFASEIHNRIY